VINGYTIIDKLGKGAMGTVKLAMTEDESCYAVKIFRKSTLKRKKEYIKKEGGGMQMKNQLMDVEREIEIMKKLDHPHVVKLHEVLDDDEGDKLYMCKVSDSELDLVLDYCAYKEILEWDIKK
jgi:[calcium/calmodulin-dependent protein kinase] kinase